jgi:hypothetical protein
MYSFMVIGAALLLVVSGFDYVRRAWVRETKPVLATWILMLVMMSLSFWMYWGSPRMSWTGNICVTAGVVNLAIILVGVIVVKIRQKTLAVEFDAVQKVCLVLGGAVVLCWFVIDEPLVLYSLVQVIALIAYAATVKKLWQAKETIEPFFLWAAVLVASLMGLYPAAVKDDTFAWIYLGRAIPSTALVICLIYRVRRKMRLAKA